jgi:hypothetical protein
MIYENIWADSGDSFEIDNDIVVIADIYNRKIDLPEETNFSKMSADNGDSLWMCS